MNFDANTYDFIKQIPFDSKHEDLPVELILYLYVSARDNLNQ